MPAAGIPGTGIGGLFYALAALLSPLRHMWRRRSDRPTTSSAREVLGTTLLALGVIAGIWVTGWLLGFLVPRQVLQFASAAAPARSIAVTPNVVRVAAIAAGFITLLSILTVVEVARLLTRPRRVIATRACLDPNSK